MFSTMNSWMVWLIFNVLWTCAQFQNLPPSPCPEIMQYGHDGRNWIGIIMAPNPPNDGRQVKIDLKLSLPYQLASNYVGKLDLGDLSSTILANIRYRRPIRYYVHFPLTYPIPNVVRIVFDGNVICSGPPATGYYVTTIDLVHVLKPEGPFPEINSNGYVGSNDFPTYNNRFSEIYKTPNTDLNPPQYTPQYQPQNTFITTTKRPAQQTRPQVQQIHMTERTTTTTPPPPPPPPEPINDYTYNEIYTAVHQSSQICGMRAAAATVLIAGGKEAAEGDWPWLTALYIKKRFDVHFICAGTLISEIHILSAAHCLEYKNSPVSPESLIVKLGEYRLYNWADPFSKAVMISEIYKHNKYSKGGLINDIAIFKMAYKASFTDQIRPACLAIQPQNKDDINNRSGTVVGWGQDEYDNKLTETPRELDIPLVSAKECKLDYVYFYHHLTDKSFCGGRRDDTGPCKGDSGGGLYMRENDRWTVRGIVSFAINKDNDRCDLMHYVAFTDVTSYYDWMYSL